ncbi:Calx-beta domain-containing protein [Hankyongella ginsenosidimutans]|uniref:Calx-beta domain-containing protein n=1 Tax=Hankyongella ginsenosidimutans TaxID=1763828 RepID=UPI001CA37F05|nr:Calx-beta domain-containing protein [Hankyongella ginsenosidimutans]
MNIAFDPIYRKYNHPTLGLQEYRLRIQNPRTALDSNGNTVTTGGIRLTPSAYCRIFHGEITNWNDTQLRSPAITGNPTTFRDTNDVTQTNANFSAPIQIVGRSDSSGTTSIFTRHLSAVCDAFVASNAFTTAGNTALPASRISTAIWNATTQTLSGTETLGLFTRSAGNEGVADYLDFRAVPSASLNDSGRGFTFNAGINAADVLTQARIGYVGPDYVLPAVLTTQTNTYGLTTADLFNANGQNVVPAPTGARLAYELFPVVAGADRQNPARWVAPLERFVPYDINQDGAFDVADNPDTATVNDPADRNPLANPFSATDPSFRAYPMLGTTNALLYTCYQAGSVRSAILRFFQEYERRSNLNTDNLANDTDQGLLDSAGLSSVPNGWQNAIRTVFFTTDTNTGDANAQAIQVVTSADGNGTFTNRFGQPSPESNQCAGLVGTGAGGGGGGESPSPPTFSINDVAATEGNALTFTVTRNGSTTSQVSVSFATQNGTAIAGSDYTAQSGTLTFGSGVTSQTISVPTVADQITEGSETFTILLSNAVGATITDGSGTGTINDQINPNEPRPTFSISGTPSVNEGGTLQFTVTKSSVTTGTYSVTATTSGGTATPGSDYTAINQLLSFAPSETSRTVTVNTVDDGTLESSETVNLTIASSNANIGTASTTGTILDNDAPPNRNPIATPSTAGVNSCKPEIFTPSVSDPDGDPLFLTSVSVGTIDGLNIIFDGSETDIPNQPPNPPSPLGGTANYNLL